MLPTSFFRYSKFTFKENPISFTIYVIAYPFALLCSKLGVSPNYVTYVSLSAAVAAGFAICNGHIATYAIFFTASYYLDYVDGTLARLTGNIGKTALRLDHTFDLVKIGVLLVSTAIYYDSLSYWIVAYFSATSFLFSTILNHDSSWVIRTFKASEPFSQGTAIQASVKVDLWSIVKRILPQPVSSFLGIPISLFLTINGHTLLIFYGVLAGRTAMFCCALYFGLLSVYASLRNVSILSNHPRP